MSILHTTSTSAFDDSAFRNAVARDHEMPPMNELSRMRGFTLDDVINSAKSIARYRETAALERAESLALALESARVKAAASGLAADRRHMRALQYEHYKNMLDSQSRHASIEAETRFYEARIADAKDMLGGRPAASIREALKTDIAHFEFLLEIQELRRPA